MPNTVMTMSALWTVREAAEYLKCSKSYLYKAAERDLISTIRIGRMVRFSPEAVRAFAAGPTEAACFDRDALAPPTR